MLPDPGLPWLKILSLSQGFPTCRVTTTMLSINKVTARLMLSQVFSSTHTHTLTHSTGQACQDLKGHGEGGLRRPQGQKELPHRAEAAGQSKTRAVCGFLPCHYHCTELCLGAQGHCGIRAPLHVGCHAWVRACVCARARGGGACARVC